MNAARTCSFPTGIVAAVALAWLAPSAFALPKAHDSDPAAVAAYQQALKQEEEQARLKNSAHLTYNRASAARDAARKHEEAIKKLQGEMQERGAAFERATKTAQEFETRTRDALEAIVAYSHAADQALQAATAFAEAQDKRQAQAADAAVEARVRALQRAQDAAKAAEQAGDSFRNGLRGVAYRSRKVVDGLHEARKSAEVLAAKSAEVGEAASAQLGEQAAQLRDEAQALPQRLKLERSLWDEMELAQAQHPKGLIQGYFEAMLDAAIEAEARSYVAAVSKASAARCKARTACRKRLDAELKEADALRAQASRAAEERRRAAEAIPASVATISRRLDEYADVASSDPQTLAEAAANAAAIETLAVRVQDTAQADYLRASAALDEARKAADAAYLAAYGEPRYATLAKKTMAAMAAPAPAHEMSVMMAAPAWQVESHAWEFFTKSTAESKDYGAYTYVLFGWRLGSRLSPQVKRNYAALLDAVITTTKHRTEVSPAIPRAKQNLFCIPGLKPWEDELDALLDDDEKFSALDNYASSLGLSILSGAGAGVVRSPEILGVIQDAPGPFLITTLEPIRRVKSGAPMLFVDLSRFPADTYADLLNAYKQALVAGPPQGQQTWQPSAVQWVASTGTGVAGHLLKVKDTVTGWFSFGAGKPAKVAAR